MVAGCAPVGSRGLDGRSLIGTTPLRVLDDDIDLAVETSFEQDAPLPTGSRTRSVTK